MAYSETPFRAIDKLVDKFELAPEDVDRTVADYRMGLLEEEFNETIIAYNMSKPEKVVDGHIDLIVVALGNLAIFGVDARVAFDRVMESNLRKVLAKRIDTDPEGASLAKPEGWIEPDHSDNIGSLNEILKKNT